MPDRKPQILVVEDDPSILLGLRVNLEAEGYEVRTAEDGAKGLALARGEHDLIILDLMIPEINGFELLQTLRAEGNRVPVLVLSARNSEMDKVTGLDLGAEDYVTKPFSLAELLARIRRILRRREILADEADEAWQFGEVAIDPRSREGDRSGQRVELTSTEFDVLALLYAANERVLSRRRILREVWGPNHHGTERTVDNFIAQLRSKLEADRSKPTHLLTVRGVGYRLVR